jgi:acetoacetyl-CoA synthetase
MLQAMTRTAAATAPSALQLLKAGHGAPLILVPGIGGSVMELRPLARALAGAAPVYGLEARGFRAHEAAYERIEEIAQAYVSELRERYPHGPYRILGYSFGGLVAYEMGQLLAAAGQPPTLLALLDTTSHERFWTADARREYLLRRGWRALRRLRRTPASGWHDLAREAARELRVLLPRARSRPAGDAALSQASELPRNVMRVREAAFTAFAAYQPRPSALALTLLRSELERSDRCDPRRIWAPLVRSLTVRDLPGDHYSVIRPPGLTALAALLDEMSGSP